MPGQLVSNQFIGADQSAYKYRYVCLRHEFSQLVPPDTRRDVCRALLRPRVYRMLIGARNPMLRCTWGSGSGQSATKASTAVPAIAATRPTATGDWLKVEQVTDPNFFLLFFYKSP